MTILGRDLGELGIQEGKMVTYFTVYPKHCNYYEVDGKNMVHGGEILAEADRAAASFVRSLLKGTGLHGLTVGVDKCQFRRGPLCGEFLTLNSSLKSLGTKRMSVLVQISDENDGIVFEGVFHFCSFLDTDKGFKLREHGLGRKNG